MSTTPPPSAAPEATTAAATMVTTPKKRSPKKAPATKRTKPPSTPQDGTADEGSPGSAPASPTKAATRPFTLALKKAAIVLKLRGMPVKKIADSLGVNYKTLWNYLDKATKNKDKVGAPDGPSPAEMSEADKKEAALALKLIGRSTKESSDTLDMNYKTLWNYLDKAQKAADLPPVVHDPDM